VGGWRYFVAHVSAVFHFRHRYEWCSSAEVELPANAKAMKKHEFLLLPCTFEPGGEGMLCVCNTGKRGGMVLSLSLNLSQSLSLFFSAFFFWCWFHVNYDSCCDVWNRNFSNQLGNFTVIRGRGAARTCDVKLLFDARHSCRQ
jgi:hypothetical protein